MSFRCFLAFTGYDEKDGTFLILFLVHNAPSHPGAAFKIFSSSLVFSNLSVMCLSMFFFFHVSSAWNLLSLLVYSFNQILKILTLISKKFFLPSSHSNNMLNHLFSHVTKALFIFVQSFFSLSPWFNLEFPLLCLQFHLLPSAVFNLLLISVSEFSLSRYCNFQL